MEEYLKILESEISNFIIHKGSFDLKFYSKIRVTRFFGRTKSHKNKMHYLT